MSALHHWPDKSFPDARDAARSLLTPDGKIDRGLIARRAKAEVRAGVQNHLKLRLGLRLSVLLERAKNEQRRFGKPPEEVEVLDLEDALRQAASAYAPARDIERLTEQLQAARARRDAMREAA